MKAIVIRKVWRSELWALASFAVTLPLSVVLSTKYPASVVTGPLFSMFGVRVMVSLPTFCLLPVTLISYAAYRVFNVRYTMDGKGLESRVGRLSFSQKISRVRFEDVRSIEIHQNLLDRLLDIGSVEVGTSGTAGVELRMTGVAAPREVQALVQAERDLREAEQPRPQGGGARASREVTGGDSPVVQVDDGNTVRRAEL
jgi:uncharacterized membrane protein YdbT with pleckstrin-like domain